MALRLFFFVRGLPARSTFQLSGETDCRIKTSGSCALALYGENYGSTDLLNKETSMSGSMDVDFAQWRLWAAKTRDRFPAGHHLREKALQLCQAMNAYHTAWSFQQRPHSAQNLTAPLEKPIEKLVRELIHQGVAPPQRPAQEKLT
jgi:hypothetical protein